MPNHIRWIIDNFRYLVAINFGNTAQTRDYTTAHSTIQSKASFDLTTGGSQSFDSDTDVDTSSLALGPMQGVAVSWDYVAKELWFPLYICIHVYHVFLNFPYCNQEDGFPSKTAKKL